MIPESNKEWGSGCKIIFIDIIIVILATAAIAKERRHKNNSNCGHGVETDIAGSRITWFIHPRQHVQYNNMGWYIEYHTATIQLLGNKGEPRKSIRVAEEEHKQRWMTTTMKVVTVIEAVVIVDGRRTQPTNKISHHPNNRNSKEREKRL